MVSRDTRVHVVAVTLAIVLSVSLSVFDIGIAGASGFLVTLLLNGLALGGSHLYLALRGDDGLVPTAARWRYVTALAVLLGAGAGASLTPTRLVGPAELAAVVLVGYFGIEALAGYRAVRSVDGE